MNFKKERNVGLNIWNEIIDPIYKIQFKIQSFIQKNMI